MKTFVFVIALGVGLLAPNLARASIMFQYVADQTSYTGTGPISANIYLQETDTTGASILGNSAVKGLQSFGFYVTQTGGPTAGASTLSGFTVNSTFGSLTSQSSAASLPPNSFDFTGAVSPSTTNTTSQTTNPSTGVYRVLLGTLTINPGANTTFTLTSMNSSNPNLNDPGSSAGAGADNAYTLPAGSGAYDLDGGGTQTGAAGQFTFNGANLSTFTFTVAAVPEPSSLALGLVAGSGLALGAWRRWRKGRA